MEITPYILAQRFIGTREFAGPNEDNPLIMAMLRRCARWPDHDEIPWCAAFVSFICFLLGLPDSRSLRARSWLEIGIPIPLINAEPGFDICILKRGPEPQPGPEVLNAPGHVGFFGMEDPTHVWILAGNQNDSVNVAPFPVDDVIGTRRLAA